MKFLVRMWAVHPITVAPQELAGLALEQLDYWDRLQQEGKVIFTAPYVGQRARVAIYEVESTDELFDLINADPLFGVLDRQITALGSNDKLRALYRQRLDASSS
jgi:muconolactone delta-isomerase